MRIDLGVQKLLVICAYLPYFTRGVKSNGIAHKGIEMRETLSKLQAVIDTQAT
eukprot:SAG25_NODE_150_length_13701_cov_6.145640_4_plen_53_part_00